MTADEYKAKMDEVLLNIDTAPEVFLSLYESLKTDLGEIDALKQTNTDLASQVRDLQDRNIKLYMRITGQPNEPDDADEPPTGEGVITEFLDKVNTPEKGAE